MSEIRLECLKLAAARREPRQPASSVISEAKEFEEYVRGQAEAPQPEVTAPIGRTAGRPKKNQ